MAFAHEINPQLTLAPVFNSQLTWGLMITEGNKP